MLIFCKFSFLDLLYLSFTCNSWRKICLNPQAFSNLDFRNWIRISQLVRDHCLTIGWSSVTEDQVFNSVLKFAVKRSLGCETNIIFPNHQRVPHAINYVKRRCPNIKSFYLGEGGEYCHGRRPASIYR
ncbi:uncharacterized protein LOC122093643 [Macadamia integrifolia]|uniref:uncharacterized protein LOC122093643 n=1 Tax=Macadamia integrifolia TaxID=60698 RepID=UPI001C52EFCE|nr:uncharacterized protein LOC122093643 [Macadamia integrifolia]